MFRGHHLLGFTRDMVSGPKNILSNLSESF